MSGLIVSESVWSSTDTAGGVTRTTVLAAVTMRKARFGWRVLVRNGCVVTTTWHLTEAGASARYDLAEHHTAEAMADRPAAL